MGLPVRKASARKIMSNRQGLVVSPNIGQRCKGLSARSFALLVLVACATLVPVCSSDVCSVNDSDGFPQSGVICGGASGCCVTDLGFTCSGSASCGGNDVTVGGGKDPHFLLTVPQSGQQLAWDFHGKGNQSYCMFSDNSISLNARMFDLPPDVTILHRAVDALESFYEGTWMDGIGVVYSMPDHNIQEQALEIVLNQTKARTASEEPFAIQFFGKDNRILVPASVSSWTSPDGTLSLRYTSELRTSVEITIPDRLKMDVWVEADSEIVSEPPIYSLSFEIKSIATTPDIHGFVGQLYAPGAIEERLQMGTLEGLLHREYVEGTDDAYATTHLTATDCSFNRFQKEKAGVTAAARTPIDVSSTSPTLSLTGRRLLVSATNEKQTCECLCGTTACSASQTQCCNNVCSDPNTDATNCGYCGKSCVGTNSPVCKMGLCSNDYPGDGPGGGGPESG